MPDPLPCIARDLTEPEPIPAAGIARAMALMQSGRLFRYGEMGADQNDVALLEQAFAALIGRTYCVAVNSGGSAIFLALKVAGVAAGEPVLVNGFTLAPVPGAIVHAGARPIIVEVTPDLGIDPQDLARKAQATGARVLVLSHMRGHIADLDQVLAVAEAHGLTVIEDCAHAVGATWDGRALGCFGFAAAFSAQTYKHFNAGEGGFLVLDDSSAAARAILHAGSYMLYRQHLSRPDDQEFEALENSTPNFSLRMTALAAALLRPQLDELPRRVARWRSIYDRIGGKLRRHQLISVPQTPAKAAPAPTSIQFSVPAFDASGMRALRDMCGARGLPIKWFGADRQIGFTSAPRHWHYTSREDPLPRTHAILATLCDIRTPLTLTDAECDLIADIVLNSIDTIAGLQLAKTEAAQRS